MATTVSYKGSTIATVSNQTKTLTTSGKYMEGNVIITDSDSQPVFTITRSYGTFVSITCNKTFNECFASIETAAGTAVARYIDTGYEDEDPVVRSVVLNYYTTGQYMLYTILDSSHIPMGDIVYYGDNRTNPIELLNSSMATHNLNVTQNGTYNASDWGYQQITVNVPFSTITISTSNPSGGSDGDVWIKRS